MGNSDAERSEHSMEIVVPETVETFDHIVLADQVLNVPEIVEAIGISHIP